MNLVEHFGNAFPNVEINSEEDHNHCDARFPSESGISELNRFEADHCKY